MSPRRRRICLFTDSREPSGLGRHMLTLARGLVVDSDVLFVCPATDGGLPLLSAAAAAGCTAVALDGHEDGREAERLARLLAWHDIDLFDCHAGVAWEGHLGIATARNAGVSSVIRTEHLPYLLTDRGQQDEHRRLLAEVDRIVCVSEGVRESFVAAGVPASMLRVARNGIPFRRPRRSRAEVLRGLGSRPSARIVLTVARFTAQKDHATLLRAVPDVLRADADALFVWVGEGPLRHPLAEQIGAAGLADRFRFLPAEDDVPSLMAASTLFVLPSVFEGLPLTVLEAMSLRVPIVATRVPGVVEAITDRVTGTLVEPGDAPALAAAIVDVLRRPAAAAARAHLAREVYAREFTSDALLERVTPIYEDVLEAAQATTRLVRRGSRRSEVAAGQVRATETAG